MDNDIYLWLMMMMMNHTFTMILIDQTFTFLNAAFQCSHFFDFQLSDCLSILNTFSGREPYLVLANQDSSITGHY